MTRGSIYFLPPRHEISTSQQSKTSGINPGIFSHPVLILSLDPWRAEADILVISSLDGKTLNEYSRSQRIRETHVPIFPAEPHPDNGCISYLDNEGPLPKKSYIKVDQRHTVPQAILRPLFDQHSRQQFGLRDASFEDIKRMTGTPATSTNPNDSEAPSSKQQNHHNDWTESFRKQEDMDRRYKTAQIITGAFAKTLIKNAGLLSPDQDHLTILDNACGTGVVAAALHDMLDQTTKDRMELTCGDFSEQMIKLVRARIEENGWRNTKAKLVDAQKTGLPDGSFTHVLANFVIMGLQEPDAALSECFRILKPGGICAFTTWQHVDWITDVRGAFATLPGPPPFPDDLAMYRSWGQGDWHSTDWIRSHIQKSKIYHFTNIEIESVGKDPVMESSAMFVDAFSVMIPMILKKFWSEQDRKEKGEMAVPALLKYMNEKYGDGKEVKMHWVANVVTMEKPLE
ncbi:MAG: hypothetical protein Q9225_004604 [Loekoesia sp. 1 TL-2023]